MSVWEREYGSTTRGHIVTLLRGGKRSVDELAAELGLTDNAVRAHLVILQREQLVVAVGVRRAGGVGKPASIYAIAPGAQPLFSRAYSPLLAALLAELRAHKTPDAMRRLLQRVGHRMAPPEPAHGTLEARVRAGAELLNELGGSTNVTREGGEFVGPRPGMPALGGSRGVSRNVPRRGAGAHRNDGHARRRVVRSRRAPKLPLPRARAAMIRGDITRRSVHPAGEV